ncbi:MAG TPA: hypothetical protein VNH20_06615 [Candidatus Dormibacteraeota bacterium]|nr:hypothetical protein [Candidatus Dormibacteraeota bacterium]
MVIKEFRERHRAQAEEERFRAERGALESGRDLEIVTLEADSIEQLGETHGSYFPEKSRALAV